ncbi:MAG: ExbD/TolR family protein [Phycisphaeraceae bacterium]
MSFASETRERARPVLPLASMLDILFLLLIFFMTASSFRDQELQVDVQLPAAESAQVGGAAVRQIVVTIQEDGSLYLGRSQVASLAELQMKLAELAEVTPEDAVVIRGDQGSDLGLAVQVLDVARRAGFRDAELGAVRPMEE